MPQGLPDLRTHDVAWLLGADAVPVALAVEVTLDVDVELDVEVPVDVADGVEEADSAVHTT